MIFEWDEEKNVVNIRKHGLSFDDALYVFADPFAVSRDDYTETEYRRQIMGHIKGIPLLVLVVYIMKAQQGEDVFRIISARKATAAERRKYETGQWL